MKVILLDDVKNVGKKGEVVKVAPGYGRNFLIRNKLAVMASEGSLDVLAEQEAEHEKKEAKKCRHATRNLKISSFSLSVS